MRESEPSHSTPKFCVRKTNGKCCIVHAYSKPNAATISAKTPFSEKYVLQNNMVGCTLYSALNIVDSYYPLILRASSIPPRRLVLRAIPAGVAGFAQELSSTPETFNRMFTQFSAHTVHI